MRTSGLMRLICSLAFTAALFLVVSAVSRCLMLESFAADDLGKLTGAEKYDVSGPAPSMISERSPSPSPRSSS